MNSNDLLSACHFAGTLILTKALSDGFQVPSTSNMTADLTGTLANVGAGVGKTPKDTKKLEERLLFNWFNMGKVIQDKYKEITGNHLQFRSMKPKTQAMALKDSSESSTGEAMLQNSFGFDGCGANKDDLQVSEESKFQIQWGQRDKEKDRQRNGKHAMKNKTLRSHFYTQVVLLHLNLWSCSWHLRSHPGTEFTGKARGRKLQNHLALISCFMIFMIFIAFSSSAFMTWLPRGIIAEHAARTWSPSPRWCSSWAAWHFKSEAMDGQGRRRKTKNGYDSIWYEDTTYTF